MGLRGLWMSTAVGLLLTAAAMAQSALEFRYSVKRDKLWGAEPGVLSIDESGVHYRSENEKTVFDFTFEDIRKADVSNPQEVRVFVYERSKKRLGWPRLYRFKIPTGTTGEPLARFLAARLARPVVGAYGVEQDATGGSVAVFHRHVLGGCDGALWFETEAIRFDSKNRKHSKTWPHADIESIGTMDPFHFRLTTYAETYNFDLKQRLSAEDYRSIWRNVYLEARESQPHLIDSRAASQLDGDQELTQ